LPIYHQHVGGQVADEAVERQQLLVWAGTADVNGGSAQAREVEGVEWLRVLEEDVVGDVDDVVDRAHAARSQPALHPVRTGTDPDPLDHAADVAAAEVGVVDA